jgi:PAS domain S-box-containing protein
MLRYSLYILIILSSLPAFAVEEKLEELLKSSLQNVENDEERLKVYNRLVSHYREIDLAKALEYSDSAVSIAKNLELSFDKANAYKMLGNVYFDMKIHNLALENFYRSLELNEELGLWRASGFITNDIGFIFYEEGLNEQALYHYNLVLEKFSGLKELNPEESGLLGFTYANIGLVQSSEGRLDSALYYFGKAAEHRKGLNNDFGVAHTHSYIGNTFLKFNYPDSAIYHYKIARDILSKSNHKNSPLMAYMNWYFGKAYLAKGRVARALEFYNKSLNMFEDLHFERNNPKIYTELSEYFLGKGNVGRAEQFSKIAIKYAEREMIFPVMSEVYYQMSKVSTAKGDIDNAIKYLQLHSSYQDSVSKDYILKSLYEFDMKSRLERSETKRRELLAKTKLREASFRYQKIFYIVGIFVLLLIGGLLYWKNLDTKSALGKLKKLNDRLKEEKDEKTKALEELRESETKFRHLMETTSAAIFIYNDKNIIYTNKQAEIMSGYTQDELKTAPISYAMTKGFAARARRWARERAAGNKEPRRFEFSFISKSGLKKWVDFSAGYIQIGGQHLGLGTAYDITERKKIEDSLRESEQLYKQLVSTSPDVITRIDSGGRFTFVSDNALEIFGYDVNSVLSLHFDEIIHPSDRDKANIEFEKILKTGKKRVLELKIFHKNGSVRATETHANPIIGTDGEIKGVISVVRDSTEKTKQREILEKSEKALKEINLEKDKLFSIIAHDLKNPVGTFKSTLKYLNDYYDVIDKSEIKELLSDIQELSSNTYTMLENLLHWSRTQRGMISFNPDIINLKPVVERIFAMVKLNASIKSNELINEISPDHLVYADSNMIDIILRNLISNSVKFTKEGKIRVSSGNSDDTVNITVQDTGIGIPEEKIQSLFSMTNKTVSYGTDNEKGTGLGLILVKEFVEMHKGKIHIDSQENRGTSVTFTLPAYHTNMKFSEI